MYCPKNAHTFNCTSVSNEHAAAWCRRVYRANPQQCHGCELGLKYGVSGKSKVNCPEIPDSFPVQGRLF